MNEYTHQLKLIIPGELPDLNQYLKACNQHRNIGAILKKSATEVVEYEVKKQLEYGYKVIPVPVYIEYHWYCKDKRKDKDNVSSGGRKFINDGLQKAHVILQDSWNAIIGWRDFFYVDKDNNRIEIIIRY